MPVMRIYSRRCLVLFLALLFLASPPLNAKGENIEIPLEKKYSADSARSVVKTENDPESPANPTQALTICSQHAPKCPLTAPGWPGEADGWQRTGKKWTWVPGTPNIFGREVVWEYSQPYAGSTPAYLGQREDHYADQTNPALPPITYDWERWMQVGENFRLMQLGNKNEAASYLVGEADCSSGIFYPVVDHSQPYYYTPMYTTRWGTCTGGGYIAAYLAEQWGDPLSQKRLALCDNTLNGVPASLSPAGNTICKISPYVGVVYQRYIFGAATPAELPSVGCEAVLYAWGWTEPQSPASGQQYQSWFRNGELRFTRWYELSNQVTVGNLPDPNEHDWWNPRCQAAWQGEGNWLYSGTFWAGSTIYQDQAVLPTTSIQVIPSGGGSLDVAGSGVHYAFPSGVFTQTVQVVSFLPDQSELPPTDGRFKIIPAHHILAETSVDQVLVDPAAAYTVTLSYADQAVGGLENSLAFYSWDGHQWLKEPTSHVDTDANVLTATPDHFSLWAVMIDGRRMYLPAVLLDK
jgi:hypothetical protein